jgi:hypothetical protein
MVQQALQRRLQPGPVALQLRIEVIHIIAAGDGAVHRNTPRLALSMPQLEMYTLALPNTHSKAILYCRPGGLPLGKLSELIA